MLLRMNMRFALGALCAAAVLIMLFWGHCGELSHRPFGSVQLERSGGVEIECSINGEYSVGCRHDRIRDEVFVPFSLIHKYFEIYGKITSRDGVEMFEWSHSYGKIFHPKKKYDPRGTFTTFENYNVEVRDRVKCISGMEGVPVSTQWDPRGFFYPTQIAQFGLAHYSKHLTEPEPKRRIIDDGEKHLDHWIVAKDAYFAREFDAGCQSNIIKFSTTKNITSQVWLKLNISQDFVLSMDIQLKPNSTLIVEDHIYYGIGADRGWQRLTRDLIVDVQKGWALQDKPKRRSPRNKFKISGVILTGAGALDNLTVSRSEHMAQFSAAARWLVRTQRRSGAWPVPVRRRIAAGVADLEPGWHSAMSQGHGMSVLARAFAHSGEPRYLRAAARALRPLAAPRRAGGPVALWMDKYIWYEEYPTSPPLFVLNGFIYTLLGLYDLHVVGGENASSPAKKMYDDGMTSLKALLPLFDTGSGSFYDLRHFTLGVSPNIARWDYHATHVNQLYLLAGLDDDPILINTAKRWEGYMTGKRAAHN